MIIAIDGHSSSGKSTFAKAIATEMNLTYIDSGAMYRSVTLFGLQNGLITGGVINQEGLTDALDDIHIGFQYSQERKRHETYLNDINIEDKIRSIDVSNLVSPVSKFREVREKLVELQRTYASTSGVVMDGRDIGTVVFPDADIKIFLVSDVNIRAARRHKELDEKGMAHAIQEVKDNIMDRDHQDSTREISPLRMADDAIVLDNTHITVEQQMEWFRELLKNKA